MLKRMRMLAGVLLLLVAGVAHGQTPGAGITGTAHDPGIWSFGGETQVCVMCHAPHGGNTQGPLWNRAANTTTYTLYASSTMNATVGQPGSVSKLCLSCHDGTVGLLDYGGAIGSMSFNDAGYTPKNLGTSLANDHPVGITYDATLATNDGGLADPSTRSVTIGGASGGASRTGTIATTMLVGGKVECNSCHDVHNRYTVANGGTTSKGLVKVSMAGSSLCLQCHNK